MTLPKTIQVLKRRYPDATVCTLTGPMFTQGGGLTIPPQAWLDLRGRVNAAPFDGHPAGTVLLAAYRGHATVRPGAARAKGPIVRLTFLQRESGWDGRFEKADFSPLASLHP